ncbi:hypothetical protein N7519_010240 [Penicillium mononematosum]|uniref:uncharacterized protein n=1 Tax=Penicillium mononematosum TaxID=268346 RepID=UPI0025471FF2|nr:uncharacterized protein N7519_010240 [Penicillium mononematosum]KAJ6179779.1 hypothetical protein N7519_010240 [Penicillium mononematosum]
MYECGTCDFEFRYREDCDAHMDEYDHWVECEACTRQFRTERSCEQHMDALDHWAPVFECETCTRTFSSQDAVNQHMNAKNHWQPTVPCETCSQVFHTEEAADQHMAAEGHYENYCVECDRRFMNENCLRQHLNSRIHRGADVVCPFCDAHFVTASGVTHHIEYAGCPNARKWNRETIHRMIQRLDPNGLVTNKQIEWRNEQNVQYYTTDCAFNGTNWECYICRKGFGSMAGLNAHLNSPVHKEKIYHCLNKRGCGKEFVSLASLFNHLESESCGYIRFGEVQNVHRRLNDAIMNRKMINSL